MRPALKFQHLGEASVLPRSPHAVLHCPRRSGRVHCGGFGLLPQQRRGSGLHGQRQRVPRRLGLPHLWARRMQRVRDHRPGVSGLRLRLFVPSDLHQQATSTSSGSGGASTTSSTSSGIAHSAGSTTPAALGHPVVAPARPGAAGPSHQWSEPSPVQPGSTAGPVRDPCGAGGQRIGGDRIGRQQDLQLGPHLLSQVQRTVIASASAGCFFASRRALARNAESRGLPRR